jgi:hypothetical protein
LPEYGGRRDWGTITDAVILLLLQSIPNQPKDDDKLELGVV